MSAKKTYYLLYELKADNIKQVQAVAAELYNRHGIEPEFILEKHEWDIKKAIDGLKENNPN